MPLIEFLLLCFGFTEVITQSKIFKPLRTSDFLPEIPKKLLKCSMCLGLWSGSFFSIFMFGPFIDYGYGIFIMMTFKYGFIASGWCWLMHCICVGLNQKFYGKKKEIKG